MEEATSTSTNGLAARYRYLITTEFGTRELRGKPREHVGAADGRQPAAGGLLFL